MGATSAVRIGRYVLYDAIAAGGMASVHLGRLVGPVGFSRTVAIKRLHPHLARDPDFVSMFLDEARLAARIQHPNVVGTVDVVAEEDELFLVMDYVQGDSLSHLVKQSLKAGQPVPPRIAAGIITGALNGLHAAHEAMNEQGEPMGIVHRDISPQNILVGADGVPRVVDFGVAKAVSRVQTTEDGSVKGKIAYMSPEQLRRQPVDRRADLYAMGVVFWEVLAGKKLFDAPDAPAVIAAVLDGDVPDITTLRPDVPPGLRGVLGRAMHQEPASRFSTALDFAAAIEQACPGAPQRDVAAWVGALASELLEDRKKLVAKVEQTPVGADDSPVLERKRLVEAATDIVVTTEPESQITSLSATTNPSPTVRALPWAALIVVALAGFGIVLVRSSHKSSSVAPAAAALTRTTESASVSVTLPPPPPSTPAASVTHTPPPIHTQPHPHSNCDPPFIIDASGVKRFKPQCI